MNMNIKLPIHVVIGNAEKSLLEINKIEEGSIIELNKIVGEPVDIYAGNNLIKDTLIAKGEVIVLDYNFCVQITEIIEK